MLGVIIYFVIIAIIIIINLYVLDNKGSEERARVKKQNEWVKENKELDVYNKIVNATDSKIEYGDIPIEEVYIDENGEICKSGKD